MSDFLESISVFTADSGLPAILVLALAVIAVFVGYMLPKRAFGFVSGIVFAGIASGAISFSQLAAPIMNWIR